MKKADISTTEYNSYFEKYLGTLPENLELIDGFSTGKETLINFFLSIPKNKLTFRYQPEKWSVKEVFQHIIDTERIMIYRCFRIAREDKTPLSSFDENAYITPSEANKKTINALINEYTATRDNSIALLNSLSDKNLSFTGTASGFPLSARAVAFIILGHENWHTAIIKERYL